DLLNVLQIDTLILRAEVAVLIGETGVERVHQGGLDRPVKAEAGNLVVAAERRVVNRVDAAGKQGRVVMRRVALGLRIGSVETQVLCKVIVSTHGREVGGDLLWHQPAQCGQIGIRRILRDRALSENAVYLRKLIGDGRQNCPRSTSALADLENVDRLQRTAGI